MPYRNRHLDHGESSEGTNGANNRLQPIYSLRLARCAIGCGATFGGAEGRMTTQQLHLFNCLYLAGLVLVVVLTRATARRIAGALAGGVAAGVVALGIIALG